MAKSVRVKRPPAKRRGAKGLQAPSFFGWEKLDGAKFHRLKITVHDFYYMNFKHTDTIEWAWTWMKENGYSKQEIASAKKAAKHEQVLGVQCKMLLDGCPDYNEKEQDYWQACPGTSGDIKPMTVWIKEKIEKLILLGATIIEEKKAEDNKKKNVYVPSIQERLYEAAQEKTDDIETWIDEFLIDPQKNKLKEKNVLKNFKKHGVNLGHVRFMRKWYTGPYEEIQELVNLPAPSKRDEMQKQLEEGYSHLNKNQRKDALAFYEKMFQAFDILLAENKHARLVRKPKVKSASELVKKLKFKLSDSDFGIASKNPADIIGASTVVVFNCKTRKVGIYHAEPNALLGVKGTTLQFFDEKKSVQKTIRKPSEVLPDWKKATKFRAPKLFDSLKTTETKLNGRFNAETVILQVYK